jgi:hypothetical protein
MSKYNIMTSISEEMTFTNQKASYNKIPCLTEEAYKLYSEGKRNYRKGGRASHREEYNVYMRHYMREKYRNDKEYRLNELARKKLRYFKLKEEKLANLATFDKAI